jgi:hypothetical protein
MNDLEQELIAVFPFSENVTAKIGLDSSHLAETSLFHLKYALGEYKPQSTKDELIRVYGDILKCSHARKEIAEDPIFKGIEPERAIQIYVHAMRMAQTAKLRAPGMNKEEYARGIIRNITSPRHSDM